MATDTLTPGVIDEWREAYESLVAAQTELLHWYRDVQGPAVRAGDILGVEAGFDDRNGAVGDARLRLVNLPAPDWKGLLIKLENHAWMSRGCAYDGSEAAMSLICSDLVRLARIDSLALAPLTPHVGPDYTARVQIDT